MLQRLLVRPGHHAALLLAGATLVLTALTAGCSRQTETRATKEAEAQRLYERADLAVRKIGEGQYSYAYINFHYNQALANIERIRIAYPETGVGEKVRRKELPLGKFTLDHFENVVLVQLGDMKEATESVVNCAIYLHTLPEADRAESRQALALILETLCRLVRSDEALIFPTLPEDNLFARETIIKTIARYLQGGISLSLVRAASEEDRPFLAAAYVEGLAVGGLSLVEIEDIAEPYKSAGQMVELAALRGMIERENQIYRDQYDKVKQERERTARLAAKAPALTSEPGKDEPVRYDVPAFYAAKFGPTPPPPAAALLAGFKALRGDIDGARALVKNLGDSAKQSVLHSYYEHLGLIGRLNGQETLHRDFGLSQAGMARATCSLVEFLGQNANYVEASAVQTAGNIEFPGFRDHLTRAYWRGRFYSRTELFYLDAKTVPAMDIKDPAVCAQVLLDWFLSPNRLLKGSSWGADAIVFKYFSMQKEGRPVSRQLLNKGKKAKP